uniref:OTU domain-containing protein n=1 Tax=viral metagenome TaxID=1070528 RepID=A0A6C0EM20_9ZZZZ
MSRRQQLNKLSILPPNKTVVFYSPIEGRDILVRTGTIGEGSCFFHALLHSHSREYVRLDKKGRMKLVAKLRSSLADKLDRKRWEEISSGLVAKIPFQENINEILHDFYRHIEKERSGKSKMGRNLIRSIIHNDNDKQAYQIICELITMEDFEKELLPKIHDKCAENKITECKETIVKDVCDYGQKVFDKIGKTVDENRKNFCVKKIETMIRKTVNEADNAAFKDYLSNLKDASVSVDTYTIGLISERFNRDIYFIDARTRMPYRVGGDENIKSRKSIIVMWVGGVHYEIVGRLLGKDRIQREFHDDDPLIKRINTYLFHPDLVAEQYPALIPYLPKNHRDRLGFTSDSRSEGDYESSSEEEESDESDESDEERTRSSSSPKRKKSRKSRHRRRHRKH